MDVEGIDYMDWFLSSFLCNVCCVISVVIDSCFVEILFSEWCKFFVVLVYIGEFDVFVW